MSSTPESKVKARVDAILTKYTDVIINPMTKGYGKSGVADKIICMAGQFIAIETKSNQASGTKKYPTKLQQRFLAKVLRNGGNVAVVNEDNIDELSFWLREVARQAIHGGQPAPLLFDGCPDPFDAEQAREVTVE